MYRKLEQKPGKLVAKEASPESECQCVCTKEPTKDGGAKPDNNQVSIYSGNHYNIGND